MTGRGKVNNYSRREKLPRLLNKSRPAVTSKRRDQETNHLNRTLQGLIGPTVTATREVDEGVSGLMSYDSLRPPITPCLPPEFDPHSERRPWRLTHQKASSV
jgi:hypothetical protein